jgi:hypothetical protein
MDDDQYSAEETARRVKAAVKGAFSGVATPLKDIPKRNGESRLIAKTSGGVPAQSKKRGGTKQARPL